MASSYHAKIDFLDPFFCHVENVFDRILVHGADLEQVRLNLLPRRCFHHLFSPRERAGPRRWQQPRSRIRKMDLSSHTGGFKATADLTVLAKNKVPTR